MQLHNIKMILFCNTDLFIFTFIPLHGIIITLKCLIAHLASLYPNLSCFKTKKHCQTDSAYYFCNWLPFYRPYSFASQTFIWFANFLIIPFTLMQKLILLYYSALLYTRKTLLFPIRHLYHIDKSAI